MGISGEQESCGQRDKRWVIQQHQLDESETVKVKHSTREERKERKEREES